MKILTICCSFLRPDIRMNSIIQVAIVFNLCFLIPVAAADSHAEDNFDRGLSEYKAGNYVEATARLVAAIENASGCTENTPVTATEDAVGALNTLIAQPLTDCSDITNDKLWDAYFFLALSYLKRDKFDEFHKQISRAKSLNPSRCPDPEISPVEVFDSFSPEKCSGPITDLDRAIKHYELGSFEAALVFLNNFLSRGDENKTDDLWSAHFYAGMSHYLLDEKKQVIAEFKEAQSIKGDRRLDDEIYSPRIVGIFSDLDKASECLKTHGNLTCDGDPLSTGDNDADDDEGMSTLTKVLIGLGVAALVGGGGSDSSSGGGSGDSGSGTVIVNW